MHVLVVYVASMSAAAIHRLTKAARTDERLTDPTHPIFYPPPTSLTPYRLINPRSFDVTVDGRLVDRAALKDSHGVIKTLKYMAQWCVLQQRVYVGRCVCVGGEGALNYDIIPRGFLLALTEPTHTPIIYRSNNTCRLNIVDVVSIVPFYIHLSYAGTS